MSIILPEWVVRQNELREAEAKKKEPRPLLHLDASHQPGHLATWLEDHPDVRTKLLNVIGGIMTRGQSCLASPGTPYDHFYGLLVEAGHDWEERT